MQAKHTPESKSARAKTQAAQSRQPCVNSHQLSQWEALGTVIFDPPTKSTYLNRLLKNLSQVIRSMTSTAVQNLVAVSYTHLTLPTIYSV